MTTILVFSVRQLPIKRRDMAELARVAIGQKLGEGADSRLEHLARHARASDRAAHPAARTVASSRSNNAARRRDSGSRGPGDSGATNPAGRGRAIAEGLQHGQDRPVAGARNGVEHVVDRLPAGPRWNDTLILIEALWAVEAIPLADAVQWIEERLVVHDAPPGMTLVQGVVGLVEHAQGQAIDQRDRRRDGERLLPRAPGPVAALGRIGTHEQAAYIGPRRTVDPRDRVIPGRFGLAGELKEGFQPPERQRLGLEPRAGVRAAAARLGRSRSGQSADRRGEPSRRRLGTHSMSRRRCARAIAPHWSPNVPAR